MPVWALSGFIQHLRRLDFTPRESGVMRQFESETLKQPVFDIPTSRRSLLSPLKLWLMNMTACFPGKTLCNHLLLRLLEDHLQVSIGLRHQ
jgi:hypothetical protein